MNGKMARRTSACARRSFGVRYLVPMFTFLPFPDMVVAQTVENRAEEVDRILTGWVEPNSPGAAVAVVQKGKIILARGYGLANLEYDVRVTPTTAFNIGSVTKQFTAFAVAMLAEQGRLSVEDAVRKYIPEMAEIGDSVKIKHILHHTGGLRDEVNLLTMAGYGLDDAITHDHVLRLITRQKELLFRPGERWEYSNSGYTLLAEIVTRVTGQAFDVWMDRNVFLPLGMTRTRFLYDLGTIIKDRAYSYVSSSDGYRRSIISKSNVGCSSLFSTAEDMAKWAANLADAKVGGQPVLDRMSQPGVLNDGTATDYAYGQFVGRYRGLTMLSHGGGIGGFRSALIRFPDQELAVVVLANVDHLPAMKLAKEIASLFLRGISGEQEMKEEHQPLDLSTDEEHLTPAALTAYVGSYRLDSTGKVLEVVVRDGQLSLLNLATEGAPLPLSPTQGGEFLVGGVGLRLSFDRDERGSVHRMTLKVGDPPQAATRVSFQHLNKEQLTEFLGRYWSDEILTMYSLEIRGGELVAVHPRHPTMVLTPIAPYEFSGAKVWLRSVRFELDEHKRPVAFRADAAYAKNMYFERMD